MIESTALFFSLMYVEQVFRMALGDSTWRFRYMVGAAVFGVLGGTVKVTTFAPYFVLGVGVVAWQAWTLRREGKIRLSPVGVAAFFTGAVPLVLTWLWTKFADNVKEQNPLTAYLTSDGLRAWNFGTLQERLHFHNYVQLLRYANDQVGYIVAGALVAIVYAWTFRRWNRIVAVCVILYAGTTLLFFNLHVIHEYYPYADAVLLVVAIGVMIAPFFELAGWKAWVGVALLVLEMTACVARYHRYYYRYQKNNSPGLASVAALVDETTRPDDVIVITGMGWSPVLPYQSQRRAIMESGPETQTQIKDLRPLEETIQRQGPRSIAAVVACDTPSGDDRLRTILQIVGMNDGRELQADHCDVYERATGPESATP
jgi:hypothetical protein